jgi:ribonuclease HII
MVFFGESKRMHYKYLIGVDEAGRGPLAGPVSVGVVLIPTDFVWDAIPGVNDSKQLAEKKREEIYKRAVELKKKGELFFAVHMESAESIDTIGIVPSVRKAMAKALTQILHESGVEHADCFVKLDGSLKAPREFLYQETIIQGDGKEKVIGLASIMAKVTRDRYMVKISKKDHLAHYVFEAHKGYGTKLHRELILQNGLSDMHRKSFCRKLI